MFADYRIDRHSSYAPSNTDILQQSEPFRHRWPAFSAFSPQGWAHRPL